MMFWCTFGLVCGMLIGMLVCWLNGGNPEPPRGES